MGGTRQGGLSAYETVVKKYGRSEDGKSILHVRAGIKGGKASKTGGFYVRRDLARTAGAKGGAMSKPYTLKARPARKQQQ